MIENECVSDHLLPRLKPGSDLLQFAGRGIAAHHLQPPELVAGRLCVHPVTVVNMQDRGRRYRCVRHFGAGPERGCHEHTEAHDSGVRHLDAHLRSSDVGIESGADVVHSPVQSQVRIGVQMNLGAVGHVNAGQVVLVYVADHPHGGEVGNRERIRTQTLHSG